MKLLLKFNLVFLLVFALGLTGAAVIAHSLLRSNAEAEVIDRARQLMLQAEAVSGYTGKQVAPLLQTQMKYTFLPQSVPSYSVQEVLGSLHQDYPDYAYKAAMINPTNPRDRAADWELDVVSQFSKSGDLKEFIGQRDTPTGRSLYFARPIRITDPACLECHSTPDAAPRPMLDLYGPSNGFGWKLNEVLGARVVSVPMTLPLEHAERAFTVVMGLLAAVFLAIGVALNVMLLKLVIQPVTRLAALADRASRGEADDADFVPASADEIGTLAEAFGRMQKSLRHAMKLLDA